MDLRLGAADLDHGHRVVDLGGHLEAHRDVAAMAPGASVAGVNISRPIAPSTLPDIAVHDHAGPHEPLLRVRDGGLGTLGTTRSALAPSMEDSA